VRVYAYEGLKKLVEKWKRSRGTYEAAEELGRFMDDNGLNVPAPAAAEGEGTRCSKCNGRGWIRDAEHGRNMVGCPTCESTGRAAAPPAQGGPRASIFTEHSCENCERSWMAVPGEPESECPWCAKDVEVKEARAAGLRDVRDDLLAAVEEWKHRAVEARAAGLREGRAQGLEEAARCCEILAVKGRDIGVHKAEERAFDWAAVRIRALASPGTGEGAP
jgi:hypothetical protein